MAGTVRIVLGDGVADGVESAVMAGLLDAAANYGIEGAGGSGAASAPAIAIGAVPIPASATASGRAGNMLVNIVNRFIFPVVDIDDGAWMASAGTDLRAMLDETVPDDNDYIYTTSSQATCEVKLLPGTDTRPHNDYTVSYRVRGSLVVRLKCGTTRGNCANVTS